MKVLEILEKFGAKPNNYYLNSEPFKDHKRYINEKMDEWTESYPPNDFFFYTPEYKSFIIKWKKRISYEGDGIKMRLPFPNIWLQILDCFFTELELECPEFQIDDIFIKYGCLNIVLSNINDKIREDIKVLENNLWDEKLA